MFKRFFSSSEWHFCIWKEKEMFNRILSRFYIQGTHDKFLDFSRMGTFIDNTHMKL